MIDPALELGCADRSIDHYGIPVLFAHVVAGQNACMALSEFHGARWIALDVESQIDAVQGDKQEHLPAHLVHDHIWSEREGLINSVERHCVVA